MNYPRVTRYIYKRQKYTIFTELYICKDTITGYRVVGGLGFRPPKLQIMKDKGNASSFSLFTILVTPYPYIISSVLAVLNLSSLCIQVAKLVDHVTCTNRLFCTQHLFAVLNPYSSSLPAFISLVLNFHFSCPSQINYVLQQELHYRYCKF